MYADSEGGDGSMLRAFVEGRPGHHGPERLAAKLNSYARLYHYVPAPAPGRRHRPAFQEPLQEERRRHYPLFPRLRFVLDGTGPTGITTRITALHAAAANPAPAGLLRHVPVLAAPLADVLQGGPCRARRAPRPGPRPHRQLDALRAPVAAPRSPCPPGEAAAHHPDHGPNHRPDHSRSWSRRGSAPPASAARSSWTSASECGSYTLPVR
ncbi:hypothetical protein [Streptomyces sp. JNUCC 63]